MNPAPREQPASEKTHVPSVSAEGALNSREPQVHITRPSVADSRPPRRLSVARWPLLALRLGLSSRRFSIVTNTSGAVGLSVASEMELPEDAAAIEAQEASAPASAALEEAAKPTGEEAATSGFSAQVSSSVVQKLREANRPRLSEKFKYAGCRMSEWPSLTGRLLDRPKLPVPRSLAIAPVSASAIPPPIRDPVATEEDELEAKPELSDGQSTQPAHKAHVAAAETSTAAGRKKDRKVWFYVPRNEPIFFNFDPLAPEMANLNVFQFEPTEQVDHFEYEYVEAEGGAAKESTGASTESRARELAPVSLEAGGGGGGDGEEQLMRKVRMPLPTRLTPSILTADELYGGGRRAAAARAPRPAQRGSRARRPLRTQVGPPRLLDGAQPHEAPAPLTRRFGHSDAG